MKRIGVFADVSNLYHCISRKYPSRKLDYRKYIKFVKDLGDVSIAIAYGSQMAGQATGFILCLKQMGFQTKFKSPKVYGGVAQTRKADWDVGIAMDIVTMIDRIDMVILGSADGDMLPVLEWAMSRGVEVVVIATGISKDLKDKATKAIEIPESLLEAIKPEGAKTPIEMVDQELQKDGKITVTPE
jgi:uncharacterized protein (TIGR00288 family)